VDTADVIGAMACDALKGTNVAFDERIQRARPHAGQIKTAANLRRLLEQSEIRDSHRDCGRVQDAYSLRCIPQVHGAALAFALDFLAIALSALAGISERRLERMVNPALSEGLPPFLAPGAGMN